MKNSFITFLLNKSMNGLIIYHLFNLSYKLIGTNPDPVKMPVAIAATLGVVFDWDQNALITDLAIVLTVLYIIKP